jgi:arginyl-tRNA synthetase
LSFRDCETEVKALTQKALAELGHHGIDIEVSLPPNPSYGDLSTTAPIRAAKSMGLKPGDAAIRIADRILSSKSGFKYVDSVSPHPAGYINFVLNYPVFALDVITGAVSPTRGLLNLGKGKVVAVEHTNVNPNKALHVGHARNLVLGDSLVRILRHLGYSVQALNYIDDSGAQVADIIVGFRYLGLKDEAPPGAKFDAYCGDNVYVKVNQEYLKDSGLKEKQSIVLKAIESGEGELAAYAGSIVDRILADQLATCWRLGATYDLLNWESQIVRSGMWQRLFETLKDKGIVKYEKSGENKGCWVIPDPETGEQKVVVRSDGTVVYVAKDIPYAAWKIGLVPDPFGYAEYRETQPGGGKLYTTTLGKTGGKVKFGGANFAVSVIDARQSYLQRIVGKVLEGIQEGSGGRYLHRGYEVVAISKKAASQMGFEIGGEFAHMSGRKGLYVNVDLMLESLKKKAREETRKRNLSESDSWVDSVAEALAVSALRYELLKQDPDKMIVFDIEDALRFEGDTGPYLLYTYARARRILDKTEGTPVVSRVSAAKLTRRAEKELVKKVSMIDKALMAADAYLSPKELARYAHELSVLFNEFYESVPVNKEEDAELRDARLALVDSASKVLAQAMSLIGIPFRQKI